MYKYIFEHKYPPCVENHRIFFFYFSVLLNYIDFMSDYYYFLIKGQYLLFTSTIVTLHVWKD